MAYQRKTLNQFERGYLCAVAIYVRSHGDDVAVTDMLNALGTTKMVGLDPYDEATLSMTSWWKRTQK